MWQDPLAVLWSVLASVWIRLTLFAASVLIGCWVGSHAALVCRGPFLSAPLLSLAVVAVLIVTESSRIVVSALLVNVVLWWLFASTLLHALASA